MNLRISSDSRFATATYHVRSVTKSGVTESRTVLNDDRKTYVRPSGKTHQVKQGDTLENIAYLKYGDSGKWYAIADANGISNPLFDLVPGTILEIPDL